MDLSELSDKASAIVSVVAALGFALLLPLYFSQRRDVQRLRAWMERDAEHVPADLAASEALLDRAETELEELLGEPAVAEPTEVAPARGAATATTPATAAARVTHDRPALERITMERAALLPHPRWRQFVARVTQPRALIAIGLAAVLLGVAAIFGSEQLLTDGDEGARSGAGAVDPADVEVAVLNGTAHSGLAGTVGADIRQNGFDLGEVTSTTPGFDQTVVMFARAEKRAAQKVARRLGVRAVQPIDSDARQLAGGADVVVIAGEDRAQ
jgi:hypothetical protein